MLPRADLCQVRSSVPASLRREGRGTSQVMSCLRLHMGKVQRTLAGKVREDKVPPLPLPETKHEQLSSIRSLGSLKQAHLCPPDLTFNLRLPTP